eukprot:356096-Prymnesium_polylepis.1
MTAHPSGRSTRNAFDREQEDLGDVDLTEVLRSTLSRVCRCPECVKRFAAASASCQCRVPCQCHAAAVP